jgi:hypothetical protein
VSGAPLQDLPVAKGDMAPEGATTPHRLGQVQLAPTDKKVLCSAMCQCDKMPDIAKDGKQLKQGCVSGRLKALDTLLNHRSPYKQEINYDMSKSPPAPIMDGGIATMGHSYLPGWVRKYWGTEPEHAPGFKAGQGLIRRPDVVIVNDPTKPPTQDNIKQIVEMKFPPDAMSKSQQIAYIKIAGDRRKLWTLKPSNCSCDTPDPEEARLPIEKLGWAAAVAAWAAFVLTRGRTPRPPFPAI